jgi:hypothetical protein
MFGPSVATTTNSVTRFICGLLVVLDFIVDQPTDKPGTGARDSSRPSIAADRTQDRIYSRAAHFASKSALPRIVHYGDQPLICSRINVPFAPR